LDWRLPVTPLPPLPSDINRIERLAGLP